MAQAGGALMSEKTLVLLRAAAIGAVLSIGTIPGLARAESVESLGDICSQSMDYCSGWFAALVEFHAVIAHAQGKQGACIPTSQMSAPSLLRNLQSYSQTRSDFQGVKASFVFMAMLSNRFDCSN